jgi:hypothetical protein
MATFSESNFRFTDPIRYFKANDPIYYEVDNIPLKQLQENNLWLKDQFEKLEYQQIFNTSNITNNTLAPGRSGFSELQPYVTNSDNKVYVRPGRYTARINDVYNLQPLQIIERLADDNFSKQYSFKTNRDGVIRGILDKFKTQLQANAIGMNGLMERAFTKASKNINQLSQYLDNRKDYPGYQSSLSFPTGSPENPYPATVGQAYIYNLAASSITSKTIDGEINGGLALPWHEANWIKKWRGVARTSIVDIQQELSITIPPFLQDDFYYIDESGVRKNLTSATQRIDLVFIYSKPIDASAATIAKFVDGATTPSKIYSPQLGIIKGAGVGLNLDKRNYDSNKGLNSLLLQDTDGNSLITPSISDELGENFGFSGIKGSFPSPDDLLNLAPALVDGLESDDINLLGQSILPIAYVVVKKNASLNANSAPILTTADIMDIRPFFRTTELTYNERSGLAAAHPQISIANPVATEFYVDSIARELASRISSNAGTPSVPATVATTSEFPRVVYSGKITGGWNSFGPEYVLWKYVKQQDPGLSDNAAYDKVREMFFYSGPVNDIYPTWDYAYWARQLLSNSDAPGTQVGDYLNFAGYTPPYNDTQGGPWLGNRSYGQLPAFLKDPKFGVRDNPNNRLSAGTTNLRWVTKKLEIDNQQATWINDLDVRVNYLNCCPVSNDGTNGIFISKERLANGTVVIEISVAWKVIQSQRAPRDERNSQGTYFAVLHPKIISSVEGLQNYQGYSNYGTCELPSVSFDIIGYPAAYEQNNFFGRVGSDRIILK